MKKIIKLAALLLWMALIFIMSNQKDVQSEISSNLVAEIIYQIYSHIFTNVIDVSTFMSKYVGPIRKLAHFSEFAILGILVYINIEEYRKDKVFVYSLLFTILYAISDEIHQLFVEGRYCSIGDMLIDSLGALTGILIFHLIKNRWIKKSY